MLSRSLKYALLFFSYDTELSVSFGIFFSQIFASVFNGLVDYLVFLYA